MIDIAIVGGGPAGLSAAINAVQRNKSVYIYGKDRSTSFIYKAEKVDNYLGMSNVSGKSMMDTFYQHALEKGVKFVDGKVLQIFPSEKYLTLNVDNEFIEAKTVILATGLNKNKTIKNEEALLGKGVSYCATCDGMLYRNKEVAVVSELSEGEEDAQFLNGICKKVTYLPLYVPIGPLDSKIRVLREKPLEVLGEEFVEGLKTKTEEIPCQGVFFIKETMPLNTLVPGLAMKERSIEVNRFMETNIKRIYAAGDCTGKPYQVGKAVGEGQIAALQAVSFIDKQIESR